MKITQIPMGTHNAQLTCYLQDPCTEMPALDRCPAILIFPGGAYAFCSDREADPVALAFLNAGYNAFVLRYSVSQNCPVEEVYINAFAEAQEAMDYLHQNAGDLHIDPEQIAVVGFSAGGHLAASVGTMGRVRPAAMLLGYAVFSVPGKALGMELPDKISAYIAENVTANVRQLEGTINKILAYKDLLGNDTDEETVSRAIQDMLRRNNEYVPTPEAILDYISTYYNVEQSVIRGQQRIRDAVQARQIAIYLIRSMTNLSLDDIGKEFDNRDHSTVLYSIQQIEKKMKKDAAFAEMVKEIKTNINSKR